MAQLLLDIECEIDHSPVYYVLVQCPVKRCRGADCPVIHTEGKIRSHKCQKCGYCFKSLEARLIPPLVDPPTDMSHDMSHDSPTCSPAYRSQMPILSKESSN